MRDEWGDEHARKLRPHLWTGLDAHQPTANVKDIVLGAQVSTCRNDSCGEVRLEITNVCQPEEGI